MRQPHAHHPPVSATPAPGSPEPQVGTVSEAYPHLIFDAFTSKLGERCANILKHLFPVPKDDSKRCVRAVAAALAARKGAWWP